ncbi:MAG TPA: sigma-70 family RNA polymerase sigma factor, partial [Bacillota bacterium]|nr:sigma-70 family RNA polymerase sigma factor [Bacillota bacterium]
LEPKKETAPDTAPDLEYLMRQHGDQVLRLAYSYLRDIEEARDAAQEVFLRVFTSLPKFQGRPIPYAWIYRITVNLCRDRLRKKRRDHWQSIYDQDLELISRLDTEEQALADLDERALYTAVMNLPVKFREVIVLYYLYQYDTKKIAQITGSNQPLVKMRLHRGRQRLKHILLENGVVGHE